MTSPWTGRSDQEKKPELTRRWHQNIQNYQEKNRGPGVALLGLACDEGVKRNHGRVGAADGPWYIRKAMANLPWHRQDPAYDAGDIQCHNGNLEAAHQAFSEQVTALLDKQLIPVGLGGGNDISWGSYLGLINYLLERSPADKKPKVGIINFDAHFDLRLPENGPSSGTPFWQMAQFNAEKGIPFHYLCLGISASSNTRALFHRARELSVTYRMDTQFNLLNLESLKTDIRRFIIDKDHIYLTIDLDVFPASLAPGVSAPAVRGTPLEVVEPLLNIIIESGKVRLFDLAELNPKYDIDHRTARLAARLIHLLTTQDTTDVY
ncbi:MAG: formimidoylglutamase [Endozoicomonas sp.]